MIFKGSQDFFGNASLSVVANDNGNTGAGGAQIVTKMTDISVATQVHVLIRQTLGVSDV